MKTMKTILTITTILLFAQNLKAEENYWQDIKSYYIAGNEFSKKRATLTGEELIAFTQKGKELAKESRNYIYSLTPDQLIIAARQCAEDIEKKVGPRDYDEAMMDMAFFFQYYPQKTNNVENFTPLLSELKDKSKNPCWRHCIMKLIGESTWHSELRDKPQQRLEAGYVMHNILLDDSEPIYLRIKAAKGSGNLLTRAYKENLSNSPVIKILTEQGTSFNDIISDVKNGIIILEPETIDTHKRIESSLIESINTQIELFSEPNLPVYLYLNLIGNLTTIRGFDEKGKLRQVMDNAIRNYKNYDGDIWLYLARANVVYFDNDVNEILPKMIEEVKDIKTEYIHPDSLLNLQRNIQKGTIEKKSYYPGISLIKLPEPKSVEPVDVNEIIDWLEQIRLEDETINNIMDANQWQEFIDAIKQN